MPKYKALVKGYDGKQIRQPGEVFEFKGKPGKWMQEVKGPGRPAKDAQPSES